MAVVVHAFGFLTLRKDYLLYTRFTARCLLIWKNVEIIHKSLLQISQLQIVVRLNYWELEMNWNATPVIKAFDSLKAARGKISLIQKDWEFQSKGEKIQSKVCFWA
jgi:nucleoid-associated protein YejK